MPKQTDPLPRPTEAELAAMEGRCEAATDGPWIHSVQYGRYRYILSRHNEILASRLADESSAGDFEFIAHARADLPRLIAWVRQLEEEVERLQSDLSRCREGRAG